MVPRTRSRRSGAVFRALPVVVVTILCLVLMLTSRWALLPSTPRPLVQQLNGLPVVTQHHFPSGNSSTQAAVPGSNMDLVSDRDDTATQPPTDAEAEVPPTTAQLSPSPSPGESSKRRIAPTVAPPESEPTEAPQQEQHHAQVEADDKEISLAMQRMAQGESLPPREWTQLQQRIHLRNLKVDTSVRFNDTSIPRHRVLETGENDSTASEKARREQFRYVVLTGARSYTSRLPGLVHTLGAVRNITFFTDGEVVYNSSSSGASSDLDWVARFPPVVLRNDFEDEVCEKNLAEETQAKGCRYQRNFYRAAMMWEWLGEAWSHDIFNPNTTLRWIVRLSDDTMVIHEHLEHVLSQYDHTLPYIIGRNETNKKRGYWFYSAGQTWAMSVEAARRWLQFVLPLCEGIIVDHATPYFRKFWWWADDVLLSFCMQYASRSYRMKPVVQPIVTKGKGSTASPAGPHLASMCPGKAVLRTAVMQFKRNERWKFNGREMWDHVDMVPQNNTTFLSADAMNEDGFDGDTNISAGRGGLPRSNGTTIGPKQLAPCSFLRERFFILRHLPGCFASSSFRHLPLPKRFWQHVSFTPSRKLSNAEHQIDELPLSYHVHPYITPEQMYGLWNQLHANGTSEQP